MQQIADWLEKLGMSEYADRFTQNRIDLSVLPELTDQHLKDLGIARSRAATASQVLGTARGDEHGAPLALSGQSAASSRTARSGLWLVHRGLRHARSEGSEGLARYTGVMSRTRSMNYRMGITSSVGRAKDVLAKIEDEKVCGLRVSLAGLGGNHDGMAKPKDANSGHFYF
jgi:SAM domain (Sterile alpha motif)